MIERNYIDYNTYLFEAWDRYDYKQENDWMNRRDKIIKNGMSNILNTIILDDDFIGYDIRVEKFSYYFYSNFDDFQHRVIVEADASEQGYCYIMSSYFVYLKKSPIEKTGRGIIDESSGDIINRFTIDQVVNNKDKFPEIFS